MKKNNTSTPSSTTTPLSIKLLYWLTSFSSVMMILVFVLSLVFNVLLYTSFFGDDMQLHTDVPVLIDINEIGSLELAGESHDVQLVETSPRIHFVDTPPSITKKVGPFISLVAFIGLYLIWTFRRFIKNIKNNDTFSKTNISLLKRLAYVLFALWIFTLVYSRMFHHYVVNQLEFDTVTFTADYPNYKGILFASLFIWMIGHVFMKGLEIQEENNLTI
jgi:hypothetical protein